MGEPKIDDLFRWFKETKVGGKKIWMRTLGASDDAARTRASIAAARVARGRLLRDTPERQGLLNAMGGMTRSECLDVIATWHEQMSRSIVDSQPQAKLHVPDPPDPEEPTLEAVLEAEEEQEEVAERVEKNRESWIIESVQVLMKQYDAKSDEELFDIAMSREVEAHANHAYARWWEYETIARSCFTDEAMTKRMFESAEVVSGIGHRAKEMLIEEYYDLDRFARDTEALKN